MIKLRHKRTGEVFELGHQEWNFPGNAYVVVMDTPTEKRYILRGSLEPVQPDPQWVDVTESLHATGPWPSKQYSKPNGIADADDNMIFLPSQHADNYYLRKVRVEWFSGVTIGEAKHGWAFIVERRHDD